MSEVKDALTEPEVFAGALVAWQKRCGRHGLPWMVADAYRRWVSEIMLQQTQVAVVKDYFARFMAAFPTVQILAAADDEAVMKLWAGLGYYSRARNLLACARVVVRDFGGVFPKDVETLATLPGIGKSTASAVASFSYGTVAPVVDGNVKRVLTRLFTVTSPVGTAACDQFLWEAAEKLVSKTHPGVFNQAMMDIGATVCTRTKPACMICPLSAWCRAFHEGSQESFPVRKPKKERPVKDAVFTVYLSDGRVWLTEQNEKGVWRGIWTLPAASEAGEDIGCFTHDFSHYRLNARVELVLHKPSTENARGFTRKDAEEGALPAPVKKFLLASEVLAGRF